MISTLLRWTAVVLVACGGAETRDGRTAADEPSNTGQGSADAPPPDLLALLPEGPENVALVHFDRLREANLLDAAGPWLMAWGVPVGPPLSAVVHRVLVTPGLGDADPELLVLEHTSSGNEQLRSSEVRPEWGGTFQVGTRVVVSAQAAILEATRAQAQAPFVRNQAAARLQAERGQHAGATAGVEITVTGGPTPWPPGLAALRATQVRRLDAVLLLGEPASLVVRAEYASVEEARRVEEALAREESPSPISTERIRSDKTLRLALRAPGEALLTWLGAAQ